MDTNRKTAIIVGVLFIIGTVAGVISAIMTGPILTGSDYLTKINPNENKIVIGALFVLIMGFALAMLPVMMFPIFRKQNETLALGAIVFRGVLETVMYIALAVGWLLLVVLSREYSKAGMPDGSYFQTVGALLLGMGDQVNSILGMVFSIGALMFYYLFYTSKLIPRWLSVWGFIGAILYFAAALFAIFRIDVGFLMAPLALQEMVLALWLIIKGFSPSATTSLVE